MQIVQWSEEATTDLVEIIEFISQRNALAAQNLYAVIVQAAANLLHTHNLFRIGRVPGTREQVVHQNYILVYQIGLDAIDVLRILHSRRQYP